MSTRDRKAVLYRMVLEDHLCPYGLKAKDLLERENFEVEDHRLETREETTAFQRERGVDTTPQIWIGSERIGGYEDLRRHLGRRVEDAGETTYQPVIAVFSVAFLMALATSWASFGTVVTLRAVEWFIAFSMCVLAILKLCDLESFSTMFLGCDLLARRVVRYGYVYPVAEAFTWVLMIAGALMWLAGPIALFIGTVGAVSVAKAGYVDRREIKCACVAGDSNVPLGFISLTENLMMLAMGISMPLR